MLALNLSLLWSRDIGLQILCFDTCQLILTWISKIKGVRCNPRQHVSVNLFSFQPQPSASTDNPYLDLDYSGYRKTSSKLQNPRKPIWLILIDSKQTDNVDAESKGGQFDNFSL